MDMEGARVWGLGLLSMIHLVVFSKRNIFFLEEKGIALKPDPYNVLHLDYQFFHHHAPTQK
jgi:hypothetical protein